MKKFSVPMGMRDMILDECVLKKQLQAKIESVFDAWGYQEVITPTIEYYSTYENGFVDIDEQEMYKFFDASGRILMLRVDMTIPIARVAATKFKDAPLPLRFRYCANVFKTHEKLSGLKDEISDCGCELIGEKEECAQLEILVTALEALKVIEGKRFVLEIGDVNFFKCACAKLGLKEEVQAMLSNLIDDKSMTMLSQTLDALHLEEKDKQFFLQLPWLSGHADILQEAKRYAFCPELMDIVTRLEVIDAQLKQLGYTNIDYDLGKASNLEYYTGLIFDAYVEGVGTRILSGGSYNTLLGRFGKPMNATGFSIKLDSLIAVMDKPSVKPGLILEYPSTKIVEAIEKAQDLRKETPVQMRVNDLLDTIVIKERE